VALKRIWYPSPNYSHRDPAGVSKIVLHTAEGALTYQSLGNFFANPSSQVSSHVGIDDTLGTIGEYVRRENKAWTQSNYNSVAVSVELCAFVAWSPDEWMRHPNMLQNCAAWIAEEAAHFGIPIVRLTDAQAQGNGRGVCDHRSLGPGGGGHSDVGPNFPWEHVLSMAQAGGKPPPTEDEIVSIACGTAADGTFHIFAEAADGDIWFDYQKKGQTNWQGGQPGKSVGGLKFFCKAPPK
jgi:hypothetical protein